MKVKETLIVTALLALVSANPIVAQTTNVVPPIPTNVPPAITAALSNPLSLLESYIVDNDATYNGWLSNHFTIWQAATFANVNGVPGASAIGNDLGVEVPVWNHVISLDSATRFEQLFGDIHSQQFGAQYGYNLNQIRLAAGLDGRYTFTGSRIQAVPYVELEKASTQLHGVGALLRYGYPITSKPGAGELTVGAFVSF